MPRVGLASANASPRIRCATVGRLTCWRPAPTYAPSKSCSGTVIWKPPPSTCSCRSGTCRQLTIRWTVSLYPAPRSSAAALNEKTKNDSAYLRGGRHPSRAGRSLSGSVSIQLWLSAAQSVSRHSALSHRSAGRSSRGRYTHRVAISNHRLLAFDQERVTFRWKDYAHGGKQGRMTLGATEFLRRFFLHVLPRGFVRIRHFGFLANRFRASRLALSRQLLSSNSTPPAEVVICAPSSQTSSLCHCPRCGAAMIVIQRFTAAELSTCCYFDSS